MPLKQGSSHETVGENIKTEMEHGKPQPQAVAIALKEAGLSNQQKDDVADYQNVTVGAQSLADIQAQADRIWRTGTASPSNEPPHPEPAPVQVYHDSMAKKASPGR